jgi:recombination protein RecA
MGLLPDDPKGGLSMSNLLPDDPISTGTKAIDDLTGIGGIPRGRITEIYGPEAGGKSTLCLQIIAQAQAAKYVNSFKIKLGVHQ